MMHKKLNFHPHSSSIEYEKIKKNFDVVFDNNVNMYEPEQTEVKQALDFKSDKLTSNLTLGEEIKSPSKMTSPEKRAY